MATRVPPSTKPLPEEEKPVLSKDLAQPADYKKVLKVISVPSISSFVDAADRLGTLVLEPRGFKDDGSLSSRSQGVSGLYGQGELQQGRGRLLFTRP